MNYEADDRMDELGLQGLLEPNHAVIDYLLSADYAEVIGGKSYVVGAGWDRFSPPTYPAPMRLGIAVGVRVPFNAANTPYHLAVMLRSADGQDILRIDADLETGRAPGSRGESMLVPLAANTLPTIERPQLLELVAAVGESTRRINIRAMDPSKQSP